MSQSCKDGTFLSNAIQFRTINVPMGQSEELSALASKSYTNSCIQWPNTYKARFKCKPDLSNIIPFETPAWVKIVSAGKLKPCAKFGYFIGYDEQSTRYHIYFLEKRSVGVKREVVFERTLKDQVIISLNLFSTDNESEKVSTKKEMKADEVNSKDMPALVEAENEENDKGVTVSS